MSSSLTFPARIFHGIRPERKRKTMMKNNAKKGFSGTFDAVTGKIRRFFVDTVAELKRCTWPTRQQLLESTGLVVVAIVILALFVFGVDELARVVIRLVAIGQA